MNDPIRPAPRATYIIWFAFVWAALLYAGIPYLLGTEPPAEPPMVGPLPGWALMAVLALANFAASIVLLPIIKQGLPKPETPEAFWGQVQMLTILRCAFYEAVAIFGLVGHLGGFVRREHVFYFVGASVLLLLLILPSIRDNHEKLNRMLRGDDDPRLRRLGGG